MLLVRQLTPENFADFGEVIAHDDATQYSSVNEYADIHANVAEMELGKVGGSLRIDYLRLLPTKEAIAIKSMIRYGETPTLYAPFIFYPFLIAVSEGQSVGSGVSLMAFATNGQQSVKINPGIWHHIPVALVRRMSIMRISGYGSRKSPETRSLKSAVKVNTSVAA